MLQICQSFEWGICLTLPAAGKKRKKERQNLLGNTKNFAAEYKTKGKYANTNNRKENGKRSWMYMEQTFTGAMHFIYLFILNFYIGLYYKCLELCLPHSL